MAHQLEIQCQGKKTINILITEKQGARKSRKIRTWSYQQDQKLLDTYRNYPKKWTTIATMMGGRNQNQCLHRYRRLVSMEDKHKIWTEEEDMMVLDLVKKMGKNWNGISKVVKTKNGKQVRERYINKLDPGINQEDWTEEEDFLLISLFIAIGSKWSEIGKRMPGRPENKIKNRFYSYVKRVYNITQMKGNQGNLKDWETAFSTQSLKKKQHSLSLTENPNDDNELQFDNENVKLRFEEDGDQIEESGCCYFSQYYQNPNGDFINNFSFNFQENNCFQEFRYAENYTCLQPAEFVLTKDLGSNC